MTTTMPDCSYDALPLTSADDFAPSLDLLPDADPYSVFGTAWPTDLSRAFEFGARSSSMVLAVVGPTSSCSVMFGRLHWAPSVALRAVSLMLSVQS